MSDIRYAYNCNYGVSVETAQTVACSQGKADKLAALAVGIQLVCQAFAPHRGGIGIGDNKAAILGHHVDRKTGRDGKIEPFAECQVFVPFPVAAKIGNGAFDLDDDKFAVPVDRHDINTPAIRQFEFGQGPETQVLKQFAHAARQQAGRFGNVVFLVE